MTLDDFLKLPTTEEGAPAMKVMLAPRVHDEQGIPRMFVSVVPAGANGRTFTAAKSAEPVGNSPEPAPLAPDPARPWWARMFGSLFGADTAQKDPGGATDFDAAMAAERLRRARWEGTDALWGVIGNILEDANITDKAGAVSVALQKFSAFVLGLVSVSLAMKGEDLAALGAEVAKKSGGSVAAKAGRVISAANLAKLTAAAEALTSAATVVRELIALGGDTTTSAKAADPPEDTPMTLEQIHALAEKAANNAVTVAKSAGVTDGAKLAEVAGNAYAGVVAKVAPTGPAQPAMPQDTLSRQIAGLGSGNMPEPVGEFWSALKALPATVAKLDEKLTSIQAELAGSGEGDKRTPGLREIATTALKIGLGTEERVAKMAGEPTEPRGSSDPERKPGEVAAKARDGKAPETDWSGSPWDFNRPKSSRATA